MRSVAEIRRDWRVRTLVPVIAIHLVAFAALYGVMYRFAVSNLENTHKFGAAILLDQFEYNFKDLMVAHAGPTLAERLSRQAQAHRLVNLDVFDAQANPIVSTSHAPSAAEVQMARLALEKTGHPLMWVANEEKNTYLFGVRLLKNDEECQTCHGPALANLGVIQMGIDLTAPMTEARHRVRSRFAMIGIAWLALFAFSLWLKNMVIGRPLAQIEETIANASGSSGLAPGKDLEELADRLHGTLWALIHTQRKREEDIAKQMVRAEQLAALGELAAGLTHEIKNPLAGVAAALELLKSEDGDGLSNREVYDQMLSELRRVAGTVDGLLRLAKPQPPQRADVDISRVVREVGSLFSARLRRQIVKLDLDISDSVPVLALDPGLIVQLLVNLLTNAMQAIERGGTIKVMVAPFPKRDGVVLIVADNGKGIAPQDLERIWDPFFTTKENGTGLGLAICRQIVEQHGGTINIESELGNGTRVVVLLPDVAAATREIHGALAAG